MNRKEGSEVIEFIDLDKWEKECYWAYAIMSEVVTMYYSWHK